MEHDTIPWYGSLILSWLPFLFWIALMAWITRVLRDTLRTKDGRSLAQTVVEYARELKRSNDLFEEALKSPRKL
ncbi:MAG: hypothetical protein QOG74_2487 [Alphaproteobacteria bacterium]|nr:hypothetical protein [Alphaproteobacteria bacterium]